MDEIEIKIKKVRIEDLEIEFKEENKNWTRNRLTKKDWKLILFCEYNNNSELKIRDSLTITDYQTRDTLNRSDKIKIKLDSKSLLGTGEIKNINGQELELTNLSIYITNKESTKNPLSLFKKIDINKCKSKTIKELYKDDDYDKMLDIYTKGLFKIYYNSLIYCLKYNNTTRNGAKLDAMISYEVIKKELNRNFNISLPNSFIKNNLIEYDALILRDGIENVEHFYNYQDVLGIVEIKTSGYFFQNKDDINSLKENIERQKQDGIPYIYIALLESYNEKYANNSYEKTLATFNKIDGCIPIVVSLTENTQKFTVPIDYDLEKIIKKIKEMEKIVKE